jgi:tetratricopeptide (TPR) repeat protein
LGHLAKVLGLDLAQLEDSAHSQPADDSAEPLRVAHEWLVSDSTATVHLAAGRRVGASLAHELEQRVVTLRHLDDVLGGRDLLPVVRRELAAVKDVLASASHAERVERRLLTVAGELAQLAGWVASDAGQYREAQRHYLWGVTVAEAAGDRVLAGQLLSSLSYQMANVGDPGEAVLLARSAAKGAEHATRVARALLLERVAWASARRKDREATRRALDAVQAAYQARSPSQPEPAWVYWLDQKEIDIMAARCLIELGEPSAAEPLLNATLAAYPVEHAREVALYRTWLAESYARAGEWDAAGDTLERVRQSTYAVGSARVEHRIAEVEWLLSVG